MEACDFEQRIEDEWPTHTLQACRDSGLMTATVDSAGGWGAVLNRLRKIGYGDLTVGRIVEGHLNALQLVETFGSCEQKTFVKQQISNGGLSAIWDSELPGRGLLIRPVGGDRFALTGTKHFASAAGKATDPVVNGTLLDRTGEAIGRQMLLLPLKDLKPAIDEREQGTLGVKATQTHAVKFSGDLVERNVFIGQPDDYLREPWLTAGASRFLALQVGALERLLELVRRDHQKYGAPGRTAAMQRAARLAAEVWQARSGLEQLSRVLDEQFTADSELSGNSRSTGIEMMIRSPARAAKEEWLTQRICAEVLMARHVIESRAHEALKLAEQAIGLKGMVSPHPLERLLRDLTVYLRQPATDTSVDRVGNFVLDGDPGHNADDLWQVKADFQPLSRLIAHSCLSRSPQQVSPPEFVHQLGRVLVVAPHPDDETLGVGGTISLLRQRGLPVAIVFLTDGEGSHPGSRQFPAAKLGQLRREEAKKAAEVLDIQDVHFMHLPDGTVPSSDDGDFESACRQLQQVIESFRPHSILTTWRRDRHGDHRAAYELCVRAGQEAKPLDPPRILEFPVWVFDARDPSEAPGDHEVEPIWLDVRSVLSKKQQALSCHASQLGQVVSDDPDGFQLGPRHLTRFLGDHELLLAPNEATSETVPQSYFDDKYSSHSDPWSYGSSQYEHDKYEHLLSLLPADRYGRGLEVGCSIGVLTERLSARCNHLAAIEGSELAANQAHERMKAAGIHNVEVRKGRVPEELPDEEFDLILLSEVGYYFCRDRLQDLVSSLIQRLRPGGHLMLMHWTVYVRDYPLTGDQVHELFREGMQESRCQSLDSGRMPFYRWDVWEASKSAS